MTVSIVASFKRHEVIEEILTELDLLGSDSYAEDSVWTNATEFRIIYDENQDYHALAAWGADALGCGLIFGFWIVR